MCKEKNQETFELICQICNREFRDLSGLSQHISSYHKEINKKQYYDDFILENPEDKLCPICGREKKFKNRGFSGYYKTCASKLCLKKNVSKKTIKRLEENRNIIIKDNFRICYCCNIKLSLSQFSKKEKGWSTICKKCTSKNAKERKNKNLDKFREKSRQYAKDHKEEIKLRKKLWYKNHKGYSTLYYQKNKKKMSAQMTEKSKYKRKNDPKYKFWVDLRTIENRFLKNKSKSKHIKELLNYSYEDFKEFMVNNLGRIQEGYTFDDWLKGELTLDHIVPQSKFPKTEDGFKLANQLKNLRLITKSQNSKKSNKIDLDLIIKFELEDLLNHAIHNNNSQLF